MCGPTYNALSFRASGVRRADGATRNPFSWGHCRLEDVQRSVRAANVVDTAVKQCYVYLMASESGTLYIGLTNDLLRRVAEQKTKAVAGFTARYGVDRLLYFESFDDILAAIAWGKQIKTWRSDKKVALIESINPQ